MAEKKTVIVIKKINVVAAGAHGGSWKVAFADFMTAMMAFFLVMWLLASPEETKRAVARYFSGPSVIEQNFSTYGAELTLEKLFLDLLNEPLKPFQTMLKPADSTPDLFSLGTKKIVMFHLMEELNGVAKNMTVMNDEISFDIPDHVLFEKGSEQPSAIFVQTMEHIQNLTMGLEQSDIQVTSIIHLQQTHGDMALADRVVSRRLDLVRQNIEASLENDSVDIKGRLGISKRRVAENQPSGWIRFKVVQKPQLPDKLKGRTLRGQLGQPEKTDMSIYDDFVRRMSDDENKKRNSH